MCLKNKTHKSIKIIKSIKKIKKKSKVIKKSKIKKSKIKKSKIKKIRGGGRYEDIITTLKTNGHYDNWVEKGSLYGVNSKYPKPGTIFMEKPYKYLTTEGIPIMVSMVTKTYRDDPSLIFIPVLNYIHIHDPTNVAMDKYKIVDESETLNTSGITTCCALALKIGTKKFLAHISASMDKNIIIRAINKCLEEQGIGSGAIEEIYVYYGSSPGFEHAKKIVADIIIELNLNREHIIERQLTSFIDKVII
jgi:hypothetical protein